MSMVLMKAVVDAVLVVEGAVLYDDQVGVDGNDDLGVAACCGEEDV